MSPYPTVTIVAKAQYRALIYPIVLSQSNIKTGEEGSVEI